jgi:aspartate kinase
MTEDKMHAGGLIQKGHLAMIGVMDVPSRPGVSGRLFSALGDQGINVELIVNLVDMGEKDHIVLCVDLNDMDQALAVVEGIREEVGGEAVTSEPGVALVSLFSLDFRERHGVASHMFKTLGDCGINIRGISTSLSTITCIINAQYLEKAVQALREAFMLP